MDDETTGAATRVTRAGRRSGVRRAAVVAALGIVAAACGSGDGGGGADGGGAAADGSLGAREDTDQADEGEPQPGGSLVYGIEADTGSPWTPQNALCAISCHTVMKSVYDTLTAIDADGVPQPYLAESVTPNDDNTVWSLVPRAGVSFHDGTPFDAAAICTNLQASKDAALRGRSLTDMASVAVSADGSACEVTMSRPWASFDHFLSGDIGYMASPTWLATALTDSAVAAAPVGTGPFVFESYTPGAAGSFAAVRNDDYWRADEGLPYLDRIEFRVFQDVQSRRNAVRDGAADLIQVSSPTNIAELREQDGIEMHEDDSFGETGYALLNLGDPESDLSDVRVRRALAMALDRDAYARDRLAGVNPVANGPFSSDQAGHLSLEESGYPSFDPEGAADLVAEYEAETGRPVEIDFLTTADPEGLEGIQYLAAGWEAVGITVNLNQVEQSQYILQAALGNFEVFAWRNHGGYTFDTQRTWWHSESSAPIGEISTNFGRLEDPDLDAALDRARESSDPAVRAEAAEEANRIFGENVYALWFSHPVWGFPARPAVNGLTSFTLPGGDPAAFWNGIGGSHHVAQLWLEQ